MTESKLKTAFATLGKPSEMYERFTFLGWLESIKEEEPEKYRQGLVLAREFLEAAAVALQPSEG